MVKESKELIEFMTETRIDLKYIRKEIREVKDTHKEVLNVVNKQGRDLSNIKGKAAGISAAIAIGFMALGMLYKYIVTKGG